MVLHARHALRVPNEQSSSMPLDEVEIRNRRIEVVWWSGLQEAVRRQRIETLFARLDAASDSLALE
jgi:hypothetical protein